ncbi:MAG: C13 family peptidase [Alphaproteobacteria bacterium]|nr:C13 family peptidase [Alphaproteobacteria bacterium]
MTQTLADLATAFKRALALCFFRVPNADTPPPALTTIVVLSVVAFVAGVGIEATSAGNNLAFNAYGLSAWFAGWGLMIFALVALGTRSDPVSLLRILMDLCMTGLLFYGIFGVILLTKLGAPENTNIDAWTWADCITCLGGLAAVIWGIAVTCFIGRVYWQHKLRLPGLRLLTITVLPLLLIPAQPTIYGSATDWSRYDVWELWKHYKDAQKTLDQAAETNSYQPPFDYEAAIYRQRDLVERMLSGIQPSHQSDDPQIYFVAAAPYASQDVFKREVLATKDLFDSRFGTAGRSAILINHQDTAVTLPMANASNLETMLNGVAKSMNVERDVLVLFLTTHGSKGTLSVSFPGYTFNDLTPDVLATLLDESGIKNRVLILSACHSGSFVSRLENADTIIMTAAHADKTSFGCSNERNWTYFGDALFNQALRKTYSLETAFEQASATIKKWEQQDNLTPSEPQISVGAAMKQKWAHVAAVVATKHKPSLLRSLSSDAARHLLPGELQPHTELVQHQDGSR